MQSKCPTVALEIPVYLFGLATRQDPHLSQGSDGSLGCHVRSFSIFVMFHGTWGDIPVDKNMSQETDHNRCVQAEETRDSYRAHISRQKQDASWDIYSIFA